MRRASVRLALCLAAICAISPHDPARADMILDVVPNGVYAAGTSGNYFDVVVRGTAGTDTVAAYQIDLSVAAGSGLTFTGQVDPAPATYLFATPDLQVASGAGTAALSYNDLPPAAAARDVSAGDVFGVGRVFFDLSAAAAGLIPVNFDFVEFVDPVGDPITVVAPPGALTIAPAAVPEPSSLILLSLAAVGMAAARRRTRRKTAN